tara:strand:+ start:20 stop:190 length:171 start_codon:yes stop_codon:yes gene_type:complete
VLRLYDEEYELMQSNGNFEKFRKSPDVGKKDRRRNNPVLMERRVTRKQKLKQKGVA